MPDHEGVVREVKKLRAGVTYEKKKHFNAGDRKERLHYWIGIPVVIINVLLGSLLVGVLSESSPFWAKWITAVFALLAAGLSAVSTFLNLRKDIEGHRRLGNRYLELSRRCSRALAKYKDELLDGKELTEILSRLSDRRYEVDRDSESYSTNKTDYKIAQKGFSSGEEEYTEKELNLTQQ